MKNSSIFSLALLPLLLTSLNLSAASRVSFMPMDRNMVVNVTERDIYGNMDSDPVDLYQIMNVEEQDSQLGKGKKIITLDKDFNMICSKDRRNCSIVLVKSARTIISGSQKYASFKLTGAEAMAMTKNFKLNERGEAVFMATDKAWRLFGNADTFILEATGSATP